MEIKHVVGKSEITDIELNKQINEILKMLKEKKQTYSINKFVLEETIKQLNETIV